MRLQLCSGAFHRIEGDNTDMPSGERTLAMRKVLGCDDLVCLVLSFVPAQDKLIADRCTLVSRQWGKLCKTSKSWRAVGEADRQYLGHSRFGAPRIELALRHFGLDLQQFDFGGNDWPMSGEQHDFFIELLERCPNLKTIHVDFTTSSLLAAWNRLPNLESLVLSREVKVGHKHRGVSASDFRAGGQKLKTLRIIADALTSVDKELIFAVCEGSPALQRLECWVDSDEMLNCIAKASSLTDLSLNVDNVCFAGIEKLLRMRGGELKRLAFGSFDCWCEPENLQTVITSIAECCRQLEYLDLCSWISDVLFSAENQVLAHFLFLHNAASLTELSISSDEIGDGCMETIMPLCPKLSRLSVTSRNLTDKSLVVISQHCQALRFLELGLAPDVTSEGLILAACRLKQLETVSVQSMFAPRNWRADQIQQLVAENRKQQGLKPCAVSFR
jgi:hypothetical protein